MRKNLLFMALFCLVIPFVSCSKSDSDSEDEYEGGGNGSKTESILIGKWIPYTWDNDDFSFLQDVGWMEYKKNHTFEWFGYDKNLVYSGDWELIEPIGKYDDYVVVATINKVGETFLHEMLNGSPFTKEQILQLLIGARIYLDIEDMFSNYMRMVRIRAIYTNGETESYATRIEWRK